MKPTTNQCARCTSRCWTSAVTTRETRELQVHAHQDAAGGGQAHGGDGEEFREGHDGGFRHGQRGKEVVQSGTARKGEESQCRKKN